MRQVSLRKDGLGPLASKEVVFACPSPFNDTPQKFVEIVKDQLVNGVALAIAEASFVTIDGSEQRVISAHKLFAALQPTKEATIPALIDLFKEEAKQANSLPQVPGIAKADALPLILSLNYPPLTEQTYDELRVQGQRLLGELAQSLYYVVKQNKGLVAQLKCNSEILHPFSQFYMAPKMVDALTDLRSSLRSFGP